MIKNQEGVVIIAVLWICALIMWIGLQISADSRLQGEEQVHLFRKSQATYLAIGGCYEALARMGQQPSTGLEGMHSKDTTESDNWQPDGTSHVVRYETGQAIVVIEAEDQKVNVNKASPQQLEAVLEKAGFKGDAADGLADVIADFIDKDDISRLHGAEKDQYKQNGLPYGPFNGPLTSLDQMLLIPGITQQIFYGYGLEDLITGETESEPLADPAFPRKHSLFDMFTVYGNNLVFLDKESAESSGLKRQINTWKSGGVYRIISCGKPSTGSPSVLIWLIVQYAPQSKNVFEILYRKTL